MRSVRIFLIIALLFAPFISLAQGVSVEEICIAPSDNPDQQKCYEPKPTETPPTDKLNISISDQSTGDQPSLEEKPPAGTADTGGNSAPPSDTTQAPASSGGGSAGGGSSSSGASIPRASGLPKKPATPQEEEQDAADADFTAQQYYDGGPDAPKTPPPVDKCSDQVITINGGRMNVVDYPKSNQSCDETKPCTSDYDQTAGKVHIIQNGVEVASKTRCSSASLGSLLGSLLSQPAAGTQSPNNANQTQNAFSSILSSIGNLFGGCLFGCSTQTPPPTTPPPPPTTVPFVPGFNPNPNNSGGSNSNGSGNISNLFPKNPPEGLPTGQVGQLSPNPNGGNSGSPNGGEQGKNTSSGNPLAVNTTVPQPGRIEVVQTDQTAAPGSGSGGSSGGSQGGTGTTPDGRSATKKILDGITYVASELCPICTKPSNAALPKPPSASDQAKADGLTGGSGSTGSGSSPNGSNNVTQKPQPPDMSACAVAGDSLGVGIKNTGRCTGCPVESKNALQVDQQINSGCVDYSKASTVVLSTGCSNDAVVNQCKCSDTSKPCTLPAVQKQLADIQKQSNGKITPDKIVCMGVGPFYPANYNASIAKTCEDAGAKFTGPIGNVPGIQMDSKGVHPASTAEYNKIVNQIAAGNVQGGQGGGSQTAGNNTQSGGIGAPTQTTTNKPIRFDFASLTDGKSFSQAGAANLQKAAQAARAQGKQLVVVVGDDTASEGGRTDVFQQAVDAINKSGACVAIDTACESACADVAGLKCVYATKNGSLGLHLGTYPDGTSETQAEATQNLPQSIKNMIAARGGLKAGNNMMTIDPSNGLCNAVKCINSIDDIPGTTGGTQAAGTGGTGQAGGTGQSNGDKTAQRRQTTPFAQQSSLDKIRSLADGICDHMGIKSCSDFHSSLLSVACQESACGKDLTNSIGCTGPFQICNSGNEHWLQAGTPNYIKNCDQSTEACKAVIASCSDNPDRHNWLCNAAGAVYTHAIIDQNVQDQISDPERRATVHMFQQICPGVTEPAARSGDLLNSPIRQCAALFGAPGNGVPGLSPNMTFAQALPQVYNSRSYSGLRRGIAESGVGGAGSPILTPTGQAIAGINGYGADQSGGWTNGSTSGVGNPFPRYAANVGPGIGSGYGNGLLNGTLIPNGAGGGTLVNNNGNVVQLDANTYQALQRYQTSTFLTGGNNNNINGMLIPKADGTGSLVTNNGLVIPLDKNTFQNLQTQNAVSSLFGNNTGIGSLGGLGGIGGIGNGLGSLLGKLFGGSGSSNNSSTPPPPPPPPTPSVTISALPNPVTHGNNITVTWQSDGTSLKQLCQIVSSEGKTVANSDGGIANYSTETSTPATVTFTATCYGVNGQTVQQQVSVTVQ